MDKVALCIIAKDRAKILPRMLNSTEGVFDIYCLQDTGSSDNTVEVFQKWCEEHRKEFRTSKKYVGKDYAYVEVNGKKTLGDFASARNDSFDLARNAGANYAFWMDTDDIIINPQLIHKSIEKMRSVNVPMALLTYVYAKAEGSLKPVIQSRERIINLDLPGKWINRVHEVYEFGVHHEVAEIKDIIIEHQRGVSEVLETGRRNSLIMYKQLEDEGIESFSIGMLNNIAYDHWEHKEYDQAIHFYKELLKRDELNNDMLFQVYIKVARAYMGLNKIDKAMMYASKALPYQGPFADPYLILAECYTNLGKWDDAIHFADKVLSMGIPNTPVPINEFEYTIVPRRVKVNAYLNKNDIVSALREMDGIVEIYPTEEVMNEKMDLEAEARNRDAIIGIHGLTKYMQANNLMRYADRLRESIPIDLLENDTVRGLVREMMYDFRRKSQKITLKDKKSIVIYAGGGIIEPWDGESDIKKGIGGSEGMTIQLSRELAKLGNKVIIYNDCGNSSGKEFDGVRYEHFSKWSDTLKSDVFISLRDPGIFSKMIKASKTYLWLHDTHYGNYPTSLFYAPNKVIVLSQAHKQIIKQKHFIKDDSVFWVTRNGINPIAYDYAIKNASKRDPYRIIYGSSYDRGLDHVLSMWPKIKKEVPEAHLDIYYGWATYDALMNARLQQGDPSGQEMLKFKEKIINMIGSSEGVIERGKVSQNEMYTAMAESSIWFYPTEFYEISCITAMSAQALGVIPVCTPYAALIETVSNKYGFKFELDKIADSLIYQLKNLKDLEKKRKPMIEWATDKFSMPSLAKEWNEEFEK